MNFNLLYWKDKKNQSYHNLPNKKLLVRSKKKLPNNPISIFYYISVYCSVLVRLVGKKRFSVNIINI
jgi:hypothetical protein